MFSGVRKRFNRLSTSGKAVALTVLVLNLLLIGFGVAYGISKLKKSPGKQTADLDTTQSTHFEKLGAELQKPAESHTTDKPNDETEPSSTTNEGEEDEDEDEGEEDEAPVETDAKELLEASLKATEEYLAAQTALEALQLTAATEEALSAAQNLAEEKKVVAEEAKKLAEIANIWLDYEKKVGTSAEESAEWAEFANTALLKAKKAHFIRQEIRYADMEDQEESSYESEEEAASETQEQSSSDDEGSSGESEEESSYEDSTAQVLEQVNDWMNVARKAFDVKKEADVLEEKLRSTKQAILQTTYQDLKPDSELAINSANLTKDHEFIDGYAKYLKTICLLMDKIDVVDQVAKELQEEASTKLDLLEKASDMAKMLVTYAKEHIHSIDGVLKMVQNMENTMSELKKQVDSSEAIMKSNDFMNTISAIKLKTIEEFKAFDTRSQNVIIELETLANVYRE
jgi:hypothetical protein